MSNLPAPIADILNEIFEDGLKWPFKELLRRRAAAAKEILIAKLRYGAADVTDIADVDEVAAMVFRYARAASEGTARRNLRLMASVLTGQLTRKPLYADEFLRWADLIASLSREEIILAVTLSKHLSLPDDPAWTKTEAGTLITTDMQEHAKRVAAAHAAAQLAAVAELVGPGKLFEKDDEFELTASALLRTGLVVVRLGGVFASTSRLDQLVKMINTDDVFSC